MGEKRIFDPDWRDLWFEKRHGLDLESTVANEGLAPASHPDRSHATFYQPITTRSMQEVLAFVQGENLPFDYFVDLGCGKGKACFLALRHGGFRKAIGIDISKSLIEVANRNKRRLRMRNVDFVELNARNVRLPSANCLVFLFNPFDEFVLDAVMRNNVQHFRATTSVVAYANDLHKAVLVRRGLAPIYENADTRTSIYAG